MTLFIVWIAAAAAAIGLNWVLCAVHPHEDHDWQLPR